MSLATRDPAGPAPTTSASYIADNELSTPSRLDRPCDRKSAEKWNATTTVRFGDARVDCASADKPESGLAVRHQGSPVNAGAYAVKGRLSSPDDLQSCGTAWRSS